MPRERAGCRFRKALPAAKRLVRQGRGASADLSSKKTEDGCEGPCFARKLPILNMDSAAAAMGTASRSVKPSNRCLAIPSSARGPTGGMRPSTTSASEKNGQAPPPGCRRRKTGANGLAVAAASARTCETSLHTGKRRPSLCCNYNPCEAKRQIHVAFPRRFHPSATRPLHSTSAEGCASPEFTDASGCGLTVLTYCPGPASARQVRPTLLQA